MGKTQIKKLIENLRVTLSILEESDEAAQQLTSIVELKRVLLSRIVALEAEDAESPE